MSISTAQRARVLIVDDQTLFRSGLAQLLSSDPRLELVGEAEDGLDALDLVREKHPDVVLMDIRMPRMDGLDATRQIAREHPDVKVLILTTFDADSYVIHALEAGAAGYVLKDARPEAIATSILAVRAGERVMAGPVADRVLKMLTGATTEKEFYDGLTSREIEILKMMAAGMPNKQVAYRLGISEKTVRNHVSNMYEKLHVYDRAQAILYAVRKGLVSADGKFD